MIGNVTVENDAVKGQRIYSVVQQSGLQSLNNALTGTYVLSLESLDDMKRYTYNYTEIRLRCYKNWHGKQIDVVLKYVDELTIDKSPERSLTNGVDFYFLPDDQMSITGFSKGGNHNNLYYHPFWRYGVYHIHIWESHRLECGDFEPQNGYNNVGNWQWYIR